MAKWEYLTLESSSNYGTTKFYVNGEVQNALKNAKLYDVMNQIGGKGWEMVGISHGSENQTFIFKRQTPVKKAPQA